MSEFLNRMRDAMDWLGAQNREDERKAIAQVLQYRLRAASAAYWTTLDLENVEQLFSLASVTREDHEVSELLPKAIASTLDYARDCGPDRKVKLQPSDSNSVKRFRVTPGYMDSEWTADAPSVFRRIEDAGVEGKQAFHIASLLGMFNQQSAPTGRNTFISFNYDTLVEDALTRLEVPWTYGLQWNTVNFKIGKKDRWGRSSESNAVPVLKLHGSVNWGRVGDATRGNAKLSVFRSYKELYKANATPRLLPPSWSKSVEDQISSIWSEATRRLETATRIVLIGFSMPETDLHFRYLLASGLQRNVSLRSVVFVNPDPDGMTQRARAVLRPSYIDQNLIQFIPSRSAEYMEALAQDRKLTNTSGAYGVDIGRRPEGMFCCNVYGVDPKAIETVNGTEKPEIGSAGKA